MSTYLAVSKEWKYFYSAPDHREYLINRITDPRETRNQAGIMLNSEKRDYMKNALMEHLKAGRETGGIKNDHWREFPRQEMPKDPDEGLACCGRVVGPRPCRCVPACGIPRRGRPSFRGHDGDAMARHIYRPRVGGTTCIPRYPAPSA